jgi:hypothetical protein
MKFSIAASLIAVALSAGTAAAQRAYSESTPSALELGVDATASIGLGSNSFTDINIPSGSIRIGFPIDPHLALEPKARLSIQSGGGSTITSYTAELGALYNFDASKMQREGLYVRPAVGISGFSGDGSQNSFFAGIGLGYKKPILRQLGTRYEAAYYHTFNNGGGNQLQLSAGLSWFTH